MKTQLALVLFFAIAFASRGADDSDFRRQIQSTTFTRSLLTATNAASARSILGVAGGQVIVSVMDYGALGNGVTDDTAALQSAAAVLGPGDTLYSPPGMTFRTTGTIELSESRGILDFSGSTILFESVDREPAVRIGPAQTSVSGLNFTLSTTTNKVTGVTAGSFAAGDMVLLYNLVQSPTDYYPGQFAFVSSATGTEMVLDRFADTALQVTNATRFVSPPDAVTIRNLAVDLSGATDGIGISAIGRGHLIENCRVTGTGTTNDPNYIGIELRGQAIVARNNYVNGILDAGNTSDRAGYGIFAAGDGIVVEYNDLSDCKHDVSTSERRAISPKIHIIGNRIRQREDWAAVASSPGLYLFLGALDVHANVKSVEIRGNDIVASRLGLSLRNGDFDVVNNRVEIRQQSGLPYVQHGNGFGEAFITRAVFSGNTFIAPTNASQFYWDHSDYGVSGVHRRMIWQGNTFLGAGVTINDQEGAIVNPFEDVTFSGNIFERTNGTPLAIVGTVSNVVISGNVFRYGGTGNGITLAIPLSPPIGREVFISGNAFVRQDGGTGFDIDATVATNIVALGPNRWSSSVYSYVGPVHGIATYVPVAMHDQRDTYPRIVGTYDGDLKFGPGDSQPSTSISMLFPGSLQTDGTWTVKASDLTQPAFGTYLNSFSNFWNFVIRGDGVQSYRYSNEVDSVVATPIVLGPRRFSDLTNGVWRISGNLGITSNAVPIVPESDTATLWLVNAAANVRDLRIVWPDGLGGKVDGKVWHQYSDGSGSGLDADLLDGQSSAAFQTALSFTNGVTNSAGVVSLTIAPGSNVTLSTNAGTVTINSSGGGGVGDVTLAGTNAFTGENSFSGLTTISNLSVPGVLSVGSITSGAALGMAIGGTGGTNAESARASLGVTYDVDVQAYRLGLLQAALALTADGHMLVHNGSLVTNLTSTAAGRALLTAASASAQWNNYLLAVASTNGAYDATSWNGISDRLVTLDQFRDAINALPGGSNAITSVTAPLSLTNGVLSIDTSGLGGGGGSGFTYLLTNAGGAFQDRASGTNWTIISTTISSNNVPTATGKFIEGGFSAMVTNGSGTSATWNYDVSVNGTVVFRDSTGFTHNNNTVRTLNGNFVLVRESATTATFAQVGVNASSAASQTGLGDVSANTAAFSVLATNIPVTWSSNVSLSLVVNSDTTVTTNTAYGLRVGNAWMRVDASATSGGSITADGTTVTNIVSSSSVTNTVAGGQTTLSVVGSGVTGINADNIASGTLASNRLPAAISLTTLSAGTLTATSVSGDGSGLTNLNGSNIASGTVAAARLPTSGVSAGSYTNPTVTIDTYGRITAATNGSESSGGGGLTLVDAAPITNVNFRSSWANKALVSGVTNVDWVPQPPTTASATSLTPAFNSSRGHEFTLTGNATLNAPSGVTSDMVGDTFRLVFIQDSTGGRTLSAATNYLFGSDITGLTLTTNAGARDYAVVYVRRTNVFDVVGFVRGYAQ